MPVAQPTPPPDRLGEFLVEHELGRGGSGVVYAARNGAQEVALKVLREDEVATPKDRARFLDEARHLARLEHPGIVRVLAVGELPDGRPFLAMERLRGMTLAERLLMQRFDPIRALVLFEQLAAAVSALHAAGLVHRDIKPENVMLVDGETRVVLLDLGIARGVDDLPSTTTQAGLQRGTPAYMAPERFFGARATVASDVYETAVVLYVMLTGDLPWKDPRSPKDRLDPRPPSALGVALPPALEAALMGAMGAEPVHRPRTIDALVASVRRGGWEGETTMQPQAVAGAGAIVRTRARSVMIGVGMAMAFVVAATVALVVMQKDRGKAAGREEQALVVMVDAGVATQAAPVEERVTVTALAPVEADAAVPQAQPQPAPQPQPQPKPKQPKPKTQIGSGSGSGSGSVAPSAADLPACRRMARLYCTDEYLATEGGLAGQLCKTMNKNVDDWTALPQAARDSQEDTCRQMYDQLAAAVAERLRQFNAGVGPP